MIDENLIARAVTGTKFLSESDKYEVTCSPLPDQQIDLDGVRSVGHACLSLSILTLLAGCFEFYLLRTSYMKVDEVVAKAPDSGVSASKGASIVEFSIVTHEYPNVALRHADHEQATPLSKNFSGT